MSRSEDFDSEFWSDPDVAELSPLSRYLYVWSWTNTRCNMSGAYQITRALILAETALDDDELDAAFIELEQGRFAFYDGRVLWVRSRVKRLRQKTVNIAKSIGTHLEKLPAGHPYVGMFLQEYADAGWLTNALSGLSADTHTTVDDTHEKSDSVGKTSTVTRLSTDSPRDGDGLGEKKEGGSGETKTDRLPEDLPTGQYATALHVHAVLTRIAAAKPKARAVTLAAVGRTVIAYPGHDLVQVAGDCEHYWCHGGGATKGMRDVVATFRRRLADLPEPPAVAAVAASGAVESTEDRRARMVSEAAARNERVRSRGRGEVPA